MERAASVSVSCTSRVFLHVGVCINPNKTLGIENWLDYFCRSFPPGVYGLFNHFPFGTPSLLLYPLQDNTVVRGVH